MVSGTLWSMADQRDAVVRKGAHGAWPLHCHIVFPMKDRKALLDEVVTTMIHETAAEIAERIPIEMEAMGTDKNHIHLRCSVHPKVVPGRIVQIFKRITAREIFRRKPAVKRVLRGGDFWSDGYYVATEGGDPFGRLPNGMCSGKGNLGKISSSSECFSSVIPRSLLRGASLLSVSSSLYRLPGRA